ncbi:MULTISPECIES: DUF1217 domain-containing protein [unclassified Mesorhizobium]|jgi:hypothetical protein|uniref:DUF1217 domain-containing protein n=1 Tax=unclassified Mesorhizobium TaxID=325217 RepID=UPI0008EF20CC|nr:MULTISPECIES: DUF1217 domain-containing protein [unclassified Mesorhizobium]RJG44103.1 DUF1217 domain-containing protein [Mesorhizobium sp. DCY119]SFU05862.1 Protein of unknown function [Mesorhizobium sp. YR577]
MTTYTSYQLIASNLTRSLDRVSKQPVVDRETKYYLENISKVKTIDEFVSNTRLFNYAMKAHGLEDMAYAKAFMEKALKEGISDPNSFANKLSDKRYAEFVRSFNFAARGEETTTYNMAQQFTAENYATQIKINGGNPDSDAVKAETTYYLANIVKVKSIDELMKNDRLVSYIKTAYAMDPEIDTNDFLRKILEGGVRDENSLANKQEEPRYAAFATAFNFEAYGEKATTYVLSQQPVTDKYLRQSLEQDAGAQNEGVRLALYFQRNAPNITNFYEVLGDKALAQVVRTALGLPDAFAQADIDKQVKYFESRLKIEDLSDPDKLGKFIQRFTALWEIENPSTSAATSLTVLFSQPAEYGVSTNLLLSIQSMKR